MQVNLLSLIQYNILTEPSKVSLCNVYHPKSSGNAQGLSATLETCAGHVWRSSILQQNVRSDGTFLLMKTPSKASLIWIWGASFWTNDPPHGICLLIISSTKHRLLASHTKLSVLESYFCLEPGQRRSLAAAYDTRCYFLSDGGWLRTTIGRRTPVISCSSLSHTHLFGGFPSPSFFPYFLLHGLHAKKLSPRKLGVTGQARASFA